MPRDIPVGNGSLLVAFDNRYQIRDVFFPHVGQENHAGACPCRFGVYADVPGTGKSRMVWTSDPDWQIRQRYLRDCLTTSVSLEHPSMQLGLYCNDAVDFHRNIFVRKIKIKNHAGHKRTIQIVQHHDFNMFGMKVGDTAYFDPELKSIIHYRGKRYLMTTFFLGDQQRIDQFATGTSGFQGAEGTWRDAEDGHLQGNAIAQGSVDSTMSLHVEVEAGGEATAHFAIIAAQSREELLELHKWLLRQTPQTVLDRTTSYWRLWVGGTHINFGNLPAKVVELFKRSLLVIRTQIDNGGAIIAANDSDLMQYSRDTYSYMWPRDGALVADALDLAGLPDVAKWFYTFCRDVITPEGYLRHKYNPDGSPASSWHPWVIRGQSAMPIQEDETALVVWALWRHYYRYRDIEYIRPLWVDMVQKAADFMVRYRDQRTGLPLPSYDLWEERWGVHAFTIATVFGALKAARNFAICFGDRAKAETYNQAAEEIKAAAAKYLWSDKHRRFVRRLIPRENSSNGEDIYEIDEVVDASLFAIYKFGMFDVGDTRVQQTMRQVESRLWIKTRVGGVCRYEHDNYHRISSDLAGVPGNPWFICTLWLADYFIARAQTTADLKLALPIFEWTASHALESGILAEQVNPYTNEPLSVSPLTWSHAAVVSTVVTYLEKLEQLQVCAECNQPMFHVRQEPGNSARSQAIFDRAELVPEADTSREMTSAVGRFTANDPQTGRQQSVMLGIDVRDCIGCEVCVAHCKRGVLRMVDGKAVIDLRLLNQCDLDGECVEVCPTDVVMLRVIPLETAARDAGAPVG
jgi:glucoamylase